MMNITGGRWLLSLFEHSHTRHVHTAVSYVAAIGVQARAGTQKVRVSTLIAYRIGDIPWRRLSLQDKLQPSLPIPLSTYTTSKETGIEENRVAHVKLQSRIPGCSSSQSPNIERPPPPFSVAPSSPISGSVNCLFRDQWRGRWWAVQLLQCLRLPFVLLG